PYSWLEVDFVFERKLSYFIVQVTGPSVLIVTIAYMSFWVNVNTGTSRFNMTVGTFLSIVMQFLGVKAGIPRVSYVTVIDIWMIACMLFVWISCFELSLVNYLFHRRKVILEKRKMENERGKKYFEEGSEVAILQRGLLMAKEGHPKMLTSTFTIESGLNIEDIVQEPDLALFVDKLFRVLYPLAFIIFNGFFWPLMLNRNLL
ncbi:glycine receptor subunit alpha-2-like protein, partial [Leptotrombidium deliense]